MNRAIISIGSNVEPQGNVRAAIEFLAARHRVVAQSRPMETDAVGRPGQPKYLNAAVVIETPLGLDALRATLTDVEAELGRVRTDDKFAPRTIDLDVITWNDQIVHPDYAERAFLRDLVREVTQMR